MATQKTKAKILFLDVETTYHIVKVWSLKTNYIPYKHIIQPSRLLCWAGKFLKKIANFESSENQTQLSMIKKLWHIIDEADIIVHYNGQSFDMPRINQEFVKLGLGIPSPCQEIDMYRVVKKNFDLPSNSLDYVCQYFGLKGKVKHQGMELWDGCIANDRSCWSKMEKYNKRDIKILEDLYLFLLPYIHNHPNVALMDGVNGCKNCSSNKLQKRGFSYTGARKYQRYQCQDCGRWSRNSRAEPTKPDVGCMR